MARDTSRQHTSSDQLIRVREAAELMDCSTRHVWRAIDRGDLPKIDIGHGTARATIRLRRSEVEALIAERTAS